MQFGDFGAVRASYTRDVRRTTSASRLAAAAAETGQLLGRPEIVNTLIQGGRAVVRVALVSVAGDGERSLQPVTLRLRREDGRWLLADARLLLDTARALVAARGAKNPRG